jgi:hypothetical protein
VRGQYCQLSIYHAIPCFVYKWPLSSRADQRNAVNLHTADVNLQRVEARCLEC